MKRIISVVLVLCFLGIEMLCGFTIDKKIEEPIQLHELKNDIHPLLFEEIHIYKEETPKIDYQQKIAMEEYQLIMRDLLDYDDDLEEWYGIYKDLKNKNSSYWSELASLYDNFTDDELNILFGVVQAEVGDEHTFQSKANVASVIFNRLRSNNFGNTINTVLTKSQFTSIKDGRYKKVKISDSTIAACEFAFEIQDTTNGALFFESKKSNQHNKYADYLFTDNAGHKFYKLKEEENE